MLFSDLVFSTAFVQRQCGWGRVVGGGWWWGWLNFVYHWPLCGLCQHLSLASLWAMPTPNSGLSMSNVVQTSLWPLYGQCQHLSLASMGNANTYLLPLYGQCQYLSPLWAMPTPISGLSMGNANTYLSSLYGQCQHLSLASKLQSRHSMQDTSPDTWQCFTHQITQYKVQTVFLHMKSRSV